MHGFIGNLQGKEKAMLPTEVEQNILAEYEAMINLLMPVITESEPDTESFDDTADYAQ